MRSLTNRVEVLEQQGAGGLRGPVAWMVMAPGETEAGTRDRYEAEHGPIGDRFSILWRPVVQAAKEYSPCN